MDRIYLWQRDTATLLRWHQRAYLLSEDAGQDEATRQRAYSLWIACAIELEGRGVQMPLY
jgi:hypothetical protein